MEIRNHKILLTITEVGRLSSPVSNISNKSIRSKIITSPFEDRILDKNGSPSGKYNTPKKLFLAPNNFKERFKLECTRKINISESTVNYFISNESCVHFIDKKKWEKMTEEERLKIHLSLNAEGKEFSYEVI